MRAEQDRLKHQIDRIKEMMELATEYKLLPDWAAVIGGSLILAATAVTWAITRSWDVKAVFFLSNALFTGVATMWVGVVLASLLLYYVIALRDAKRLGVSLESRPSQLARRAMAPSLLAAAVVSVRLLWDATLGYLPGIWILAYGVALFNAGLFSTPATRALGLLFMATGTLAILVWPELDLLLTALSFGVFHVGFGWWVLNKKSA